VVSYIDVFKVKFCKHFSSLPSMLHIPNVSGLDYLPCISRKVVRPTDYDASYYVIVSIRLVLLLS